MMFAPLAGWRDATSRQPASGDIEITMTPHPLLNVTRRHFLRGSMAGLGGLALAQLFGTRAAADGPADPLAVRPPHFAPKAKNVIYLHMAGSPPHLDLLDYKPELLRLNGQDCPQSFLRGRRFAFTSGTPKLLGTPQKFAQHGKGGNWLSEALPQLATVADELCIIRSMTTEQFNHAPAELLLFT